jgi:hypothetical protein
MLTNNDIIHGWFVIVLETGGRIYESYTPSLTFPAVSHLGINFF